MPELPSATQPHPGFQVSSSIATESSDAHGEREWFDRILPMVRDRPAGVSLLGRAVRQIVALDRERLLLARGVSNQPIPETCYQSGGLQPLIDLPWTRKERIFSLAEITSVRVSRPSVLTPKRRIEVRSNESRARIDLDDHECSNLVRALQALLGDRLELLPGCGLRLDPRLIIFLVLCLVITLLLAAGGIRGWPWALPGVLAALGLGLLVLDNVPRSPSRERPRRPVKAGVPPLRSLWVGRVLRVAAGLWIIGVFFSGLSWLYLPGVALLYAGYLLSARDGWSVLERDSRAPVLYLRSFRHEGRTNLNPSNWLATAAGLRASEWIERLPKPLPKLFNLHPVRLLRLAFGRATDTAETQLGDYFHKFGPFVAIGEPGERLAEPGAARMYVGHDQWQQVVTDLMTRSQIVLVEPAATEGIWWEVDRVMSSLDPSKVVLCLVNFQRRQDDYETFRVRLELGHGVALPRSVGNLDVPSFIAFEPDRTARLRTVDYRTPYVWPFLNLAADLPTTLDPVVRRAEGQPLADSPSTPTRYPVLLPGIFFLLLAAAWAQGAVFLKAAFASLVLSLVTLLGFAPSVVYQGHAVPYRLRLDPAWQEDPSAGTSDLSLRRDDGSEMLVAAGPQREDFSQFRQSYLSNLREQVPGIVDEPETTVEAAGRRWSQFALHTDSGPEAKGQLIRYYAGPEGSYILVGTYRYGDDAAQRAVIRAMQGFEFPPPAGR